MSGRKFLSNAERRGKLKASASARLGKISELERENESLRLQLHAATSSAPACSACEDRVEVASKALRLHNDEACNFGPLLHRATLSGHARLLRNAAQHFLLGTKICISKLVPLDLKLAARVHSDPSNITLKAFASWRFMYAAEDEVKAPLPLTPEMMLISSRCFYSWRASIRTTVVHHYHYSASTAPSEGHSEDPSVLDWTEIGQYQGDEAAGLPLVFEGVDDCLPIVQTVEKCDVRADELCVAATLSLAQAVPQIQNNEKVVAPTLVPSHPVPQIQNNEKVVASALTEEDHLAWTRPSTGIPKLCVECNRRGSWCSDCNAFLLDDRETLEFFPEAAPIRMLDCRSAVSRLYNHSQLCEAIHISARVDSWFDVGLTEIILRVQSDALLVDLLSLLPSLLGCSERYGMEPIASSDMAEEVNFMDEIHETIDIKIEAY